MCRNYQRRDTHRAKTKTTDIARPTCSIGIAARSARNPRIAKCTRKTQAGERTRTRASDCDGLHERGPDDG